MSIAAQSHPPEQVVMVIADRESGPLATTLAQEAGLRFDLVEPTQSLDSVRAFEAGLSRALDVTSEGDLIALSDQDDIWHDTRLARGVAALRDPDVMLAHSDARLVDAQGAQRQPSMFAFEKRHPNPGLRGLLYRNNITGMTATFRRELVALALPFPPQSGVHYYHDLWLGLLAAATGRVALITDPLVDYRQHDANAIGAVDRTGQGGRPARSRLDMQWMRREAAGYGLARYLGRSVQARVAQAVAVGSIPAAQVDMAALRPYLRRRSVGTAHFMDALKYGLRGRFSPARMAVGQGITCVGRQVWALRKAMGEGLYQRLDAFDQRLYSMSPGVEPPHLDITGQPELTWTGANISASDSKGKMQDAESFVDERKRPSWTPRLEATAPSINVLVPTLNPTEVFAGIATAIDIGIGLAARGYRVRLIACDLPIASLDASRRFVLGRLSNADADAGAQARLSLGCGVMGDGQGSGVSLPSHSDDLFLVTAWWTAHVARDLIAQYGYRQSRPIYLLQDFEPNFYAWGTEFADAMASYDMDVQPVFNTTYLRDYFAQQGFAFADAAAQPLAFRPSIDIDRYASGLRPKRSGPKRLALYGRPEVARNMFPMAVEALALFVRDLDLTPDDIEIVSMGLPHDPVSLPNQVQVSSLGKLPWDDYPDYLLSVDLGLSLMYSPHPSHPPLEMAASGVRVVTNHFGPKDLSRLSGAITSVAPTPEALAEGLAQAWRAGDVAPADRAIDLGALGLTMEDMMTQLATQLSGQIALATMSDVSSGVETSARPNQKAPA